MIRPVLLILILAFAWGCSKKSNLIARDVLTRGVLDSVSGSMMLTEFPTKNVSITMRPKSGNQSVTTWNSRDGVSLSFKRGVLVATRGLGDDLMSSDVDGSLNMLTNRSGSGFYQRFQTYLDGEYQSQFRSFQCQNTGNARETIVIFERRHATVRIEETCHSPDYHFTNIYWRNSGGVMLKTRQWISPSVGYLVSERLVL